MLLVLMLITVNQDGGMGTTTIKSSSTIPDNGCTSRPLIYFSMYFPSHLVSQFWGKRLPRPEERH